MQANLLTLGSFFVGSAGLTLFHTFPKDPLDISSVMLTVAGSLLGKHTEKDKTMISLSMSAFVLHRKTKAGACGWNKQFQFVI